jgi:GTPase SAR1 family protein
MAKFGKKNKVSLNPLDANICLLGLPKIGKTTIMKEVAEKLVGEDGYLFLEMYRENGAKYIEDIVYEDVPDWDTFVEIIDDIIDNRTTDYNDLKVVILDTLDNALQLAEQESIRLWNKENPQKRTTAINAAWGGYMKGQDKAMELLQEQLFRLRTVGVAFSVIGHVKQSTITDPITNETYQQITSDVSNRYFNQLKKNIDLVGIAYIDRELVKNKVNGKEVSTVKSETRKIKFRDDNYTVDSGSRMSQIVSEINFDADEFIKAMTDALEAEVKKGGKSVEDRKKENEKDEADKLKRIAEAEEAARAQKDLDAIKSEIVTFFTENKKDLDKIKPVLDLCRENNFNNPMEIDDLAVAKKVIAACK